MRCSTSLTCPAPCAATVPSRAVPFPASTLPPRDLWWWWRIPRSRQRRCCVHWDWTCSGRTNGCRTGATTRMSVSFWAIECSRHSWRGLQLPGRTCWPRPRRAGRLVYVGNDRVHQMKIMQNKSSAICAYGQVPCAIEQILDSASTSICALFSWATRDSARPPQNGKESREHEL